MKKVHFTNKFKYLGSLITSLLNEDAEIETRIKKANNKEREDERKEKKMKGKSQMVQQEIKKKRATSCTYLF